MHQVTPPLRIAALVLIHIYCKSGAAWKRISLFEISKPCVSCVINRLSIFLLYSVCDFPCAILLYDIQEGIAMSYSLLHMLTLALFIYFFTLAGAVCGQSIYNLVVRVRKESERENIPLRRLQRKMPVSKRISTFSCSLLPVTAS